MRIVATAAFACGMPGVAAAQPAVAARIATLLAIPSPLPIDARDLETPSALRDALIAAGFVRVDGKRYGFTTRGLAASRACPRADALDDPSTRCFAIARRTFERIVTTRTTQATIDTGARHLWLFTLRAVPSTQLGTRLAASGSLVCNGRNGEAIAWRGDRTTAFGDYARAVGEPDDHDDAVADCPRGPRSISPVDAFP